MPNTIQYTYNTPLKVSHKYIGLHNISFDTWRVLRSPTKTYKKTNTFIGVFCNQTPKAYVTFRGVLFMAKTTQYTCNTPHVVSHKYIGLHNISFETWRNFA